MNRIVALVVTSVAAAALVLGASAMSGQDVLSPGPVHQEHLDTNCTDCHEPWRGVTDEKCVDCHDEVEEVGTETYNVHEDFDSECAACHTDHQGRDGDLTALIDHSRLTGSCESCHTEDLRDEFLPGEHFDESCGDCHGTDTWEDARFDHDEYFPLRGDHEMGDEVDDCDDCHPDDDFEEWTCYSDCHDEHTERAIKAEHREEGIDDWDPCLDCHPTGREPEDEPNLDPDIRNRFGEDDD